MGGVGSMTIDDKELEDIGYIEDPKEIKVEFKDHQNEEYFKNIDKEYNEHFGGNRDKDDKKEQIKKVAEEDVEFAIKTIVKEAEHDRKSVEQIFTGMFSAFTKIGMPHTVNSKNAGAGKSYILNKVAEYFPEKNVILLASASAKAILHRHGTMVIRNEKTGKLEEVELILDALEDELERIESVDKKDRDKSRIREINREIKHIKTNQKKLINLENMIIVVQDTPEEAFLINIISLLSQDSNRDQEYDFNDKTGSGQIVHRTNIFRGMPVLFTTRVIDDTRNTRFDEINRRSINVTPNVSKAKIDSAVRLIVMGYSLLPEEYDKHVVSRQDKEKAKNIVSKIIQNLIAHTKNLKPKESGVRILFDAAIYNSIPTSEESVWAMTVANRLTRYLSVIGLINMDSRPKLINTQTGQSWVIPTFKDLRKALELMESGASEIRPYIAYWFNNVFKPTYDEHVAAGECDYRIIHKIDNDGKEIAITLTEDRIALTTQTLIVKTSQILGIPKPSAGDILKNYLYPLLNQGIIDKIPSKIDKRSNIYFPADENRSLSSLFANSDDIRLELTDSTFHQIKEAVKKVLESILDLNIEKNIPKNITTEHIEKNKIYRLEDAEGNEISAKELVEKFLSNPETCFKVRNSTI
jgi:hypothetical protein